MAVMPTAPERPLRDLGARGERYKLKVRVGILSSDGQTLGSVQDISATGARIEGAEAAPPVGSELRLGFSFYAYALPVPIRGRVVRHTETGGFAVGFMDVDFRTQILLRALLPKFSREEREAEQLGIEVPPGLLETCAELAEAAGQPLHEWVIAQLELAVKEAD